jgi:hypothetical protein
MNLDVHNFNMETTMINSEIFFNLIMHNIKGKVPLEQATKGQTGSRGIAILFL